MTWKVLSNIQDQNHRLSPRDIERTLADHDEYNLPIPPLAARLLISAITPNTTGKRRAAVKTVTAFLHERNAIDDLEREMAGLPARNGAQARERTLPIQELGSKKFERIASKYNMSVKKLEAIYRRHRSVSAT